MNAEAITIRNPATSPLVKALRPCFIKIKELPQTNDNVINMIQEMALLFIEFR